MVKEPRYTVYFPHTRPFRKQLRLQLDILGGARVYEPTIKRHSGGQSTPLLTQDVETCWSQHPGPDSFYTSVSESVIASQSLVWGLNKKDHKDHPYTLAGAAHPAHELLSHVLSVWLKFTDRVLCHYNSPELSTVVCVCSCTYCILRTKICILQWGCFGPHNFKVLFDSYDFNFEVKYVFCQ